MFIVCLQSAMDCWVESSVDLGWAAPHVGSQLDVSCSRMAPVGIIKLPSRCSLLLQQAPPGFFTHGSDRILGGAEREKVLKVWKLTIGIPSLPFHSTAKSRHNVSSDSRGEETDVTSW